jgi:hypothetical protein
MLKKDIDPEFAKSLCEDSNKALQFIADIKWENGFVCKKCGHTNYCSGKTVASRRCTRCKKEESATAHTLFHNCKFPINKAFFIVYNVCFLHNKISANDLSDELEINSMTCWKFRKKVKECILRQKGKSDDELNVNDIILMK